MSGHEETKESWTGRRVGVLGATGSIGVPVGEALERMGAVVVRFSRNPQGKSGEWRGSEGDLDLGGLDAVVNLAGESVAQRWSAGVRERIVESRVGLTGRVVEGLARLGEGERPAVLVNASAVGYYGSCGDLVLREEAGPGGDFLARVCVDWEAAARGAEELGVRVVRVRTGVVLGRGGEAWTRLGRVFRLGLGGVLGNGRQWMPWIHLEDEVAAILFALEREEVSGPLNLSAPEPLRNREFTRMMAEALHRPAVLRVPGWALRVGLGDFADSLLGSCRAVPAGLMEAGYVFRHANFGDALGELCG